MTGIPHGPVGWPFLVGRGRTYGYRSLLIPDFLVQEGLPGLIEEHVRPGSGPLPSVAEVGDLPEGALMIVYRTHRVARADVAKVPAAAGHRPGPGTGELVLDEQDRPIDILYGFVCWDVTVIKVDDEDLATAKRYALAAYREFFADEAGAQTLHSQPFPLVSPVMLPPTAKPPAESVPVERRRGPAAYVTALVLFVAAFLGGLLLWNVAGTPTAAAEPPPRTAEPVLPASFAGAWRGVLLHIASPPVPRLVTVELGCGVRACRGPAGVEIGRVVDSAGCAHLVTMERATERRVAGFVTATGGGSGCLPDGRLDLVLAPGGTLLLSWYDRDRSGAPFGEAKGLSRSVADGGQATPS